MATTDYGVNHPLAVKLWSRKLFQEALKQTYASRFMGKTSSSLIQILTDTQKDAGDRITVGLRMQPTGDGIAGDGTLEGAEEAITTYSDNLTINQLRHAHRLGGAMSEQRVPFNMREECRVSLQDWWAGRIDTWFFNQIAGNTGQADTRYTGMQAAIAPSTGRIIYADGASTTEGSLSASQTFQLSYLDKAVTLAKTATPLIRPLKVDGEDMYVCFLHPNQVYSLRTDVSTSRITWYDTQKARVQGGERDQNPIFSGALGVYNGVILHESTRIPLTPTNASARRAVFCGAQAAAVAFGKNTNGPNSMNWVEEMFDYKNQFGVSAGMIAGLKKLQFNSTDFGTIVISSYAVDPT